MKKTRKKISFFLLFILSFSFIGCGVKGDPLPPLNLENDEEYKEDNDEIKSMTPTLPTVKKEGSK